jgi:hypothetical protein
MDGFDIVATPYSNLKTAIGHAANDEGTASRRSAPQGGGRGKSSRDPMAAADSYLRPEGWPIGLPVPACGFQLQQCGKASSLPYQLVW